MLKSDATTGTLAMALIRAIYQSLRARSVTGVYPHANHAPAWALDYRSTFNVKNACRGSAAAAVCLDE
jgi:hypothetical protein